MSYTGKEMTKVVYFLARKDMKGKRYKHLDNGEHYTVTDVVLSPVNKRFMVVYSSKSKNVYVRGLVHSFDKTKPFLEAFVLDEE